MSISMSVGTVICLSPIVTKVWIFSGKDKMRACSTVRRCSDLDLFARFYPIKLIKSRFSEYPTNFKVVLDEGHAKVQIFFRSTKSVRLCKLTSSRKRWM
jgi:hypothetical protein